MGNFISFFFFYARPKYKKIKLKKKILFLLNIELFYVYSYLTPEKNFYTQEFIIIPFPVTITEEYIRVLAL